MADTPPDSWDESCSKTHPSPDALKADNDAALDERVRLAAENADLKAAVDEMLSAADAMAEKLIIQNRQIAEYRRALAPFARLEAPPGLADDIWLNRHIRTGDVREAKRVMGGDGK